jgi:hypothetical protein
MIDEKCKMFRWEPGQGEDLAASTAEFCELFGGCQKCPGWTNVEELRKRGEVDEALNQTVFCIH